jgi:hypothetical protein
MKGLGECRASLALGREENSDDVFLPRLLLMPHSLHSNIFSLQKCTVGFKKNIEQCLRCLGGVDAVQKLELEVRVSAIRKSKRWKESLIWKKGSQREKRVHVVRKSL